MDLLFFRVIFVHLLHLLGIYSSAGDGPNLVTCKYAVVEVKGMEEKVLVTCKHKVAMEMVCSGSDGEEGGGDL